MASHKVKTYCRFCHAYCPMEAEVEDGRLLKLGPDTDNPVYGGYTCIKGRQLVEQTYHPQRLQASQKKQADSSFTDIPTSRALDEIAEQLQAILEKYGPRSIASYNGTYSYQNSAAHAVARAFHTAIDSPSFYASVTIDQPAKVAIGPARMGWWGAGSHMWCDSDVSLIIGNNTLVSHYSIPGGIPSFSPSDALREGRKRGLKVICVDPRKSEVARRSGGKTLLTGPGGGGGRNSRGADHRGRQDLRQRQARLGGDRYRPGDGPPSKPVTTPGAGTERHLRQALPRRRTGSQSRCTDTGGAAFRPGLPTAAGMA
jgi:anaerobic selenocysteine-containing dehydrogenase